MKGKRSGISPRGSPGPPRFPSEGFVSRAGSCFVDACPALLAELTKLRINEFISCVRSNAHVRKTVSKSVSREACRRARHGARAVAACPSLLGPEQLPPCLRHGP